MKFIKNILLLVLLITVGAAGVYVAANRGLLPTDLQSRFSKVAASLQQNNPQLGTIAQDASSQLAVLSQRAGEVQYHVGQVLGAKSEVGEADSETTNPTSSNPLIAPASSEAPIHQRAFEYTRYQYCVQVVKDYESRQ